jgi:hypothetical protein
VAVAPNKVNVQVKKGDKVNVQVKKGDKIFINQSGTVIGKISDLADVDASAKKDGSLLIYDETQSKFLASTLLEKQEVDGGQY